MYKISPLDKMLLQCIAKILEEKTTLVKVYNHLFDAQFLRILSFTGFPTHGSTVSNEIDYLEELGVLKRVEMADKYMGKSVHYQLTAEGWKSLV